MTYFFFYVILNVVKDPTEELTGIYFSLKSWDISLALNMTYFFYVILNDSEESHRRTDGAYTLSLWSWDISLALNMTYFFFYVILNVVKDPTE